MMSIGLHCRLIGRPGRFEGLRKFVEHIQQHERVWVTRRVDIANIGTKFIQFRTGLIWELLDELH